MQVLTVWHEITDDVLYMTIKSKVYSNKLHFSSYRIVIKVGSGGSRRFDNHLTITHPSDFRFLYNWYKINWSDYKMNKPKWKLKTFTSNYKLLIVSNVSLYMSLILNFSTKGSSLVTAAIKRMIQFNADEVFSFLL